MRLTSISDVITNSSTEVFTFYHRDTLNEFKEIITNIMSMAREDIKFDDIFDLEVQIDDYDMNTILEAWNEQNPDLNWNDIPREKQENFVMERDNNSYESTPRTRGYKVSPKKGFEDSPKIEKIVEGLNRLSTMWDTRAIYC